MIDQPVNDRKCLGQITGVVRSLVAAQDPVLHDLASRFATPHQLARWIRSLPQRDDEGLPDDGPKAPACSPPQRIRIPAPDPNCVERSALYIGVAELIDERVERALVTVNTKHGRHTFPVEDDRPVVLDPRVTRNALDGAMFQLDRRRVEVSPSRAVDWMAAIAEEPAERTGNLHRVRNARAAMRSVMAGVPISQRSLCDIAYTVDKAYQEAPLFGKRGCLLHHQTSSRLVDAIITQRRRHASMEVEVELDSMRNLSWDSLGSDTLSALGKMRDELGKVLAKVGINQKDLEKELLKKGLPAAATAIGGPVAGSVAAVGANALVSELYSNSSGVRNASFLSLKTPGVINDEIHTTDTEIRALDSDISNEFRDPFAAQLRRAELRFEQERARKPAAGDYAQVYAWMVPVPDQVDVDHRSYHGQFVAQWEAFVKEWRDFVGSHEHWYQRMWKGDYDKAIEFRERAVGWREQFQGFGGHPTTPKPPIPVEEPWKPIILIAGLGVAALVIPELLRSFRSSRAAA
jgi:hypothetical protein